jgi:hypothetical protein
MQPIHKNIINKIVKLYFYNFAPNYFSEKKDDDFYKNISLYFKSSNEFIQMKLVEKNGWTIQYMIKNGITPSEKVQLTAVNQNGGAIHYIENPSEKVQLAAVNRDVWAIYYIKNLYPSVIELHEEMSGLKYDKKHQFIP